MNLKYIVIKNEWGEEVPVIFPEALKHTDIKGDNIVISAGFCQLNDGDPCCFGESLSLSIKARPDTDAELMRDFFFKKEAWE